MNAENQLPVDDLTPSGGLNAVPWYGPDARDEFAVQLALAMREAAQLAPWVAITNLTS